MFGHKSKQLPSLCLKKNKEKIYLEMIRKWLEEYSVITMYINFQRRSCDGVSLVMVSLQNIERPFFFSSKLTVLNYAML